MDKNIADQAVEAYMAMVDMTTSFMWPLKLGSDDLPTSQIAVLYELQAQGRMNLTQLAHQVSVAKQTMTDISSKLIKLGYVERVYDERNRRQIQLQLTPEGSAYIDSYIRTRQHYMRDQVFSSLSKEQLRQLLDACHTLCNLQKQTIIGDKFGKRTIHP